MGIRKTIKRILKENRTSRNGHPIINIGGIDVTYIADTGPIDGDEGNYDNMVYFSIPDNDEEEEFTKEEENKLITALTDLGFESVEELGPGQLYGVGDIELLDWVGNRNSDDFDRSRQDRKKSKNPKNHENYIKPTEEIYDHILTTYVPMVVEDVMTVILKVDGFTFYDLIIFNAVDKYMDVERSSEKKGGKEGTGGVEGIGMELFTGLKDYWQPF
jgi:hypothetical protein